MRLFPRIALFGVLAAGGCNGSIGDPENTPEAAAAGPASADAGQTPSGGPVACQDDAGCNAVTPGEPQMADDAGAHRQSDAASGHGSSDAKAGPGDADSGNPIQPPLSGTVTAGTWQAGDISVPGVTLPSGKPFHYDYLLPASYDPHFTYPILVQEHEDMEGSAWYEGQNTDPLYLASASGADGWYNNSAWRTAYPCIVLLPYADQSSNGSDGNDALENFGGWTNAGVTGTGTTFSGDSGPNVFAVAGMVESFLQTYSTNPAKVYITGDSLGGIGSWYMILMYNRVNGPSGKLFTAALPFAGVMELNGFGSGPTAAQIAQLTSVPVFAVSGAQDGTSLPQDWNQPMWTALAGNSNYPRAAQRWAGWRVLVSLHARSRARARRLGYLPPAAGRKADVRLALQSVTAG